MSFRRVHRTAPILSIQANPGLERDLRFVKRFVRRFDYRICAASDEAGWLRLHVPVYRDLTFTGEASVDASAAREPHWTRQQRAADSDSAVDLRASSFPTGTRFPSSSARWATRPFVYPTREDRFEPDAGGSQNVFYLPEAAQARVRSRCAGASSPAA